MLAATGRTSPWLLDQEDVMASRVKPTQVRPPDRPLWVVLSRAYDVLGKETVSIFHASISPDRSHTEIFLDELRRLNPHAIFEMAEC